MARDYARIASTFWTRGSGKRLRGDPIAQVVAMYLFSCPAGNMVGLFHLALPTLLHEIGLGLEAALAALAKLEALDIAHYDAEDEVCWLPAGPRIQLGASELHPTDKRIPSIRREIAAFSGHPLHAAFVARWGAPLQLGEHAPSKPLPPRQEAPSKPLPEQKGDRGSAGAGAGAGAGTSTERKHGESASPSAVPPSPFTEFVTRTWPDVTEPPETRWLEAYPAVDLLAEARKAAAWEASQPAAKRKRDHRAFLGRWFARAQEDAAKGRGAKPLRPEVAAALDGADLDELERGVAEAEAKGETW